MLLGILFLLSCSQAGRQEKSSGTESADTLTASTPYEVAEMLGLGWNLGNQMDAHNNGVADETSWQNPAATQATFDSVARAGFTSVRIPITWLGKVGKAPEYKIEGAYMDRVAELVGWAEQAGLKVIINIHHDGADSRYWLNIKEAAKNDSVLAATKAQLAAMWTQIAERFKEKGRFLIFEAMNEIHDGGWGWGENRTDGGRQYGVLNEWNQVFVDAVRNVGGKNADRYLAVPGYCTNPSLTIEHLKLPVDRVANRLWVSVHFYDPYQYALDNSYTEWGHTGRVGKALPHADENSIKEVFGQLKARFVDQGIPVYIGEMGCVHRDTDRGEAFRKYYLEYICKAAKEHGLATFFWDNGYAGTGKENSGLIDHATGAYLNNAKEVIAVMKKAVFTKDESYTLETIYNNAPL